MDLTPPPINASSAPRPGWWSRNWKWFVPTGCLGIVALGVGFVALIVVVVFGAMKSTDVYKDAVAQAKASPEVIAALGSPINEGLLLTGSTHMEGSSGSADLSIPISGPKGKATVYAVATKSAGKWNYSQLVVEIAQTEQRIDLMTDDLER